MITYYDTKEGPKVSSFAITETSRDCVFNEGKVVMHGVTARYVQIMMIRDHVRSLILLERLCFTQYGHFHPFDHYDLTESRRPDAKKYKNLHYFSDRYTDPDDEDEDYEYDDGKSMVLVYNQPVILGIDRVLTSDAYAKLMNVSGYPLTGSNSYDDGNLCLGQSFNTMTLEALQLLTESRPNRDLEWTGPPMVVNREIQGKADGEIVMWESTRSRASWQLPTNLIQRITRHWSNTSN